MSATKDIIYMEWSLRPFDSCNTILCHSPLGAVAIDKLIIIIKKVDIKLIKLFLLHVPSLAHGCALAVDEAI
ncbi:hypothetical protein V6N13_088622 [Hibiscus sabdariffa]